MGLSDKVLGALIATSAVTIFAYYSVWVLVLPIIGDSHAIARFFPARVYAIAIPATLLVLAISLIAFFIGVVLISEKSKKKRKE